MCVRAAVARVDKNIALFDIKTVDAQIGDNVRLERALRLRFPVIKRVSGHAEPDSDIRDQRSGIRTSYL